MFSFRSFLVFRHCKDSTYINSMQTEFVYLIIDIIYLFLAATVNKRGIQTVVAQYLLITDYI